MTTISRTIGHLACGLFILVAGCAAGPRPRPTSAASAGQEPLRVVWFHAAERPDGIAVTGLARRVLVRPGPVPGFIRITALRSDEAGLTTICLASRDLRPAGTRGGTFAATLRGRYRADRVAVSYVRTCA